MGGPCVLRLVHDRLDSELLRSGSIVHLDDVADAATEKASAQRLEDAHAAAWLAVRTGNAAKPDAYSWRQLCGAGALGGIGFTMSLFIAGVAFPDRADYLAAKIAIFLTSLTAGGLGILVLWPRLETIDEQGVFDRPD